MKTQKLESYVRRKAIRKYVRDILDANSGSSNRKVAGDIIMDPTVSSLPGRVEGSKHIVRNAESDGYIRAREGLKNIRVSIEELDFVDVVGLQEKHHLGRW